MEKTTGSSAFAQDGQSFPPVSIIITNYNGRHLLGKYLSSIVIAAQQYHGKSEIIVADDCSTDDSVEFIRTNYPGVRLVSMERNSGLLKNANHGLSAASHDIVILLNNDVMVEENFIEPLVRHFDDEDVFSVNPKGILPGLGYANESFTRAIFRNGVLDRLQVGIELDDDGCFEEPQPCLYACGGYAAYNKGKFLALGGFDPVFIPDSVEDQDIGYLAWKVGWKTIYEPMSIVHHQNHSSIGKREIREIRNNILATWKNLDDLRLWIRHCAFFAGAFIRSIWKRDPAARMHMKAMREALPRVFQAIRSRRRKRTIPATRTDREILSMLAPPDKSEVRYRNAAVQLDMLRSRELLEILGKEPKFSDNRAAEILKKWWPEWLRAYSPEYEDRLGHLGALRNVRVERQGYLQNLFGIRLLRIYGFCKSNWNRTRAFIRG